MAVDTPILQPRNLVVNESQFAPPLTTPFHMGERTSFEQNFAENPVSSAVRDIQTGLGQLGVTKYDPIKEAAEDKQAALERQDLMDNMAPGFISWTGKTGAGLLANFLDPGGLATGAGVEKTLGEWGAMTLASMANKNIAAKLVTKAAFGAAEGATISFPYVMSSKDYYQHIQMPMTDENVINSLLYGAALGGLMRTAFGYKKPITSDNQLNALATAKAQADAGNKVDIGMLLQDGAFKERLNDADANPEKIASVVDELKKVAETTKTDIENSSKTYNESIKGHEDAIPLNEKPMSSSYLLDRIKTLNDKPIEMMNEEEKAILDRFPNTDEAKTAMTYGRLNNDDLRPNQQKFLDNFQKDEAGLTQKGIDKNTSSMDKLSKTLEKTEDLPEREKLGNKINELKNKIDESNKRIAELDKISKEPIPLKQKRMSLQSKMDDARVLDSIIKDTSTYSDLVAHTPEPLKNEDVKAAGDRVRSWEAKATTHLNEYYKNVRDMQKEPVKDDVLLKYYMEEAEGLKENGKLDPEELDALEEIKNMPDNEGKINQALKSFIECKMKETS